MAEITAAAVKNLREKTGAGMMDCKKALTETSGDFEQAIDWLRKKGIMKAASKGSRVAAEGMVVVESSADQRLATVVEVNSETDFVARNPDFQTLAKNIASTVLKHAPAEVSHLLELAADGAKKVSDSITEAVAKIGENISVRRFQRFEVDPNGAIGTYLHSNGRVAAMVALTTNSTTGAQSTDVANLARELAMQVAAAYPKWINREGVPHDVIEKEKEIFKAELAAAKKPEAIWDKILVGKLEKYFEGVCLVDQVWIKDDKKKVKDLLVEASKKLGHDVAVKQIVRFEVGEGIEKKKENFAEEVAAQLKK